MRLKELRESRGLYQKDLAAVLHTSTPVYNRYETGDREPPFSVLLTLADYYGVSIDHILGRDPVTDAPPTREGRPEQDTACEFRMLARAMEQLRPDRQQKAIELMRLLMEEDDEGLDQATRVLYALRDKP